MAVNLCAAHKKTDSHAAHEVLLACFLQSCITQRLISCSTQNIACVLYTKVNSHVTCEFWLSHSTKIEEHTRVAARECRLRRELYRSTVNLITISSQCSKWICCTCIKTLFLTFQLHCWMNLWCCLTQHSNLSLIKHNEYYHQLN